jgi:hypothetical protein
MATIAGFSFLAFVLGAAGILLVLRILVGGTPVFGNGSPKCEEGIIKFQIDPDPANICRCIGIKSYIDDADELPHDPSDVTTWHERPFPGSSPVTLKVVCEYALFPTSTEPKEATVQPCSSSSSSSSSSEESSSSSSSEESSSSSSSSAEESSSSSSSSSSPSSVH